MWELMSMENWWNERSMGEPKYLETNLSQCHFVPHGLAWDQAQIMWWEAGDWPPEPWHSQPVTDHRSHGTVNRRLTAWAMAQPTGDWPPEPWHSQLVTDHLSHGTANRWLTAWAMAQPQDY